MTRRGNPLWKWSRSKLVGAWNGWSWDAYISEQLTEPHRPRPVRILGYVLDNVYERMRYLAGARWSQRLKKHDYVGISVARVVKKVMCGDW